MDGYYYRHDELTKGNPEIEYIQLLCYKKRFHMTKQNNATINVSIVLSPNIKVYKLIHSQSFYALTN